MVDTQNHIVTVEYPVGELQPQLLSDDVSPSVLQGLLEGTYHVIYVEVEPEQLLKKIEMQAKMEEMKLKMEQMKLKHTWNTW